MATELDLEQLKQIFSSLGEKLANTTGDKNIIAKLAAVEKAIADLNKQQETLSKKTKDQAKKDREDLVKSLIKGLEDSDINKNLEESAKNNSANSAGQNGLDPSFAKEFKNFKGLGGKVGGSILALGKFTTSLAAGATNVALNTGKINGTISGLLSAFGITGKTAVAVAAAMDENIDAYRGLIDSGEGTIKSIIDMRTAASNAGLTIGEFSDALAKGTQGARLLGGQNWSALYKGIKDQTRTMAFYGYTSQQLVEAQNDYLDTVANTGSMFDTSQDDIIKGLDAILKASDKTATIMGLNRKDVLKAASEQARDATYATKVGLKLDDPAMQAQEQVFQTFLEKSGLGNIGKTLFNNDGGFGKDKESAQLSSYIPGLTEAINETRDLESKGLLTQDKQIEQQQKIASLMSSIPEDVQNQLVVQSQNGNIGSAKEVLEAFQAARKVQQPGDDPQKQNRGTNLDDDFSNMLLKFNVQTKEAAAGVQQFFTELLKPWIEYFKQSFGPLSEGLDNVISGFRGMVSGMSNFSSAVMALGGVLAGGVILTKTVGLAASILGSTLFSGLGSILKFALRPIGLLASGVFNLVKLLGNNIFTRAIASAVVSGMGGLGAILSNAITTSLKGLPAILSKLPGLGGLAKAGVAAAGIYGVDAVAGMAGVGDNTIDQDQDNKNWKKMNWWQTIESSLARGVENVGDYIAPNTANQARASRIADETTYLNTNDPTDNSSTKVQTTDDSQQDPMSVDALTKAVNDSTAGTQDLNDTIKSVPTSTTQSQTDQMKPMLDQAADLAVTGQMTPEQLTTIARQANSMNVSEISPVSSDVRSVSLDTDMITKAITDAGNLSQTQMAAMAQILQRILDTLKQNLDYSQQSGALERQSLSDIAKLQEDLIRITRR
jgi:hypothetical protein